MYKKKWFYWPVFFALILLFMFATAPYKRTHVEGPYLRWLSDDELQFTYLNTDSVKSLKVPAAKGALIKLQGQLSDRELQYPVRRNPEPPAAVQEGVEKILVLGDMHGMYSKLFNYLKNNKVVDQEGHWIWGKGQLVMCGDVLDRGNRVTETLWFLYRLEQEAAAAGGAVHYLLGNHELMVMEGDLRYVNKRYHDLFRKLKLSYQDQFSQHTVFGQWLRSRNTALLLNDLLITHAGISPQVAEQGLELSAINRNMQGYLQQQQKDSVSRLLTSPMGPLWFRGYVMPGETYDSLRQDEVEQILSQYKAKHMVVAHTTVDSVQARYQGKVFAVDLEVNEWRLPLEGLLYERGEFFRLKDDATAIKL